jgi:hypothetical protein
MSIGTPAEGPNMSMPRDKDAPNRSMPNMSMPKDAPEKNYSEEIQSVQPTNRGGYSQAPKKAPAKTPPYSGAGGTKPRHRRPSKSRISAIKAEQKRLKDAGFDVGGIDGIVGPRTRAARAAYAKSKARR